MTKIIQYFNEVCINELTQVSVKKDASCAKEDASRAKEDASRAKKETIDLCNEREKAILNMLHKLTPEEVIGFGYSKDVVMELAEK